jgi:hypothetical protein
MIVKYVNFAFESGCTSTGCVLLQGGKLVALSEPWSQQHICLVILYCAVAGTQKKFGWEEFALNQLQCNRDLFFAATFVV